MLHQSPEIGDPLSIVQHADLELARICAPLDDLIYAIMQQLDSLIACLALLLEASFELVHGFDAL